MESRLIYESSKTFISKIKWTRKDNAESEWQYFDLNKPESIADVINNFFIADTLHVSLGRQNSYTEEKSLIYNNAPIPFSTVIHSK